MNTLLAQADAMHRLVTAAGPRQELGPEAFESLLGCCAALLDSGEVSASLRLILSAEPLAEIRGAGYVVRRRHLR